MAKFDPANPFGEEGMLAVLMRLADENDRSWRRTRKGDRRPREDVAKQMESARRNRKAKQDAAAERLARERAIRNSTARPPGEDIASRMLKAMEPGKYYGMGDLVRLIGEGRAARAKVHQVLVRRKWVEKARNPHWSGVVPSPDEIEAGAEPHPQHLYRLTEAGFLHRNGLDKLNKPV
ncbi:alkylated DNA nucleotide flippase Atl1 [Bradyrhizobium diazoefficiens]|jgi:alkylated DNA nucleotide flippase Atl1|uniref:hypothetical protein n=1 Tax=Bradyrhizobium diazoefficiens TaxID=1355477 RepID=UPI003518E084